MSIQPPGALRTGDYVMNFPVERPGDRDTARQAMKRNGCRVIRFEVSPTTVDGHDGRPVDAERLIAHGYVARMAGDVEDL